MSSRLSEELAKLHRHRENELRDRARKLAETGDGRGVAECYARIDEHGMAMSAALSAARNVALEAARDKQPGHEEELWVGESPEPKILAVLPMEGYLWQLPDSAVLGNRAHGILIGAENGGHGWFYYAGIGLFPASAHQVEGILRDIGVERENDS